jgi:hypothetical protein
MLTDQWMNKKHRLKDFGLGLESYRFQLITNGR